MASKEETAKQAELIALALAMQTRILSIVDVEQNSNSSGGEGIQAPPEGTGDFGRPGCGVSVSASFLEQVMQLYAASQMQRPVHVPVTRVVQGQNPAVGTSRVERGSGSEIGASGSTIPLLRTPTTLRRNGFSLSDGFEIAPTPNNSSTTGNTIPLRDAENWRQPSAITDVNGHTLGANTTRSTPTGRTRAACSPVSVTSSIPVPLRSAKAGLTGNDGRNYMRRMRTGYLRNQRTPKT
ncbi:hypothetical protein M758_UG324300 [Ceratodon purpureus]|nr:hypothetical protein M758_UG324300 [Ceratodon purpureus]